MKASVKQDILKILDGVVSAFNRYNADEIMEWSNHIIHSASIYQDRYTSMTALVVFSIGKILARGKVRRFPQAAWNEFETIVRSELDNALLSLKNDDLKSFDKSLLELQQAVMRLDKSFKRYIETVVDQAKLKKGAKVHEHGVSMKRVAELFRVSEWELMNYAGKTRIIDRDPEKSEVKKRMKYVRELFK